MILRIQSLATREYIFDIDPPERFVWFKAGKLRVNSKNPDIDILFRDVPGKEKFRESFLEELRELCSRYMEEVIVFNWKTSWNSTNEELNRQMQEKWGEEHDQFFVKYCLNENVITPVLISDEFDEGSGENQLLDQLFSGLVDTANTYDHLAANRVCFCGVTATNSVFEGTFPGKIIKLEEESSYVPLESVHKCKIMDLPSLSPSWSGNLEYLWLSTRTSSTKSHPIVNLANFRKHSHDAGQEQYDDFVNDYHLTVARMIDCIDSRHRRPHKNHCLITWCGLIQNDHVLQLAEKLRRHYGNDAVVIPYCRIRDKQYDTNWLAEFAEPIQAVEKIYQMDRSAAYSKKTIMLLSNAGRRTMLFPNYLCMAFSGTSSTEVAMIQRYARCAGDHRNNTFLYLSDEAYNELTLTFLGTPPKPYSGHSQGKRFSLASNVVTTDVSRETVKKMPDSPAKDTLVSFFKKIDKLVLNQEYQKKAILKKGIRRAVRGGELWYKHNKGKNLTDIFSERVFLAVEELEQKKGKILLLRFTDVGGVKQYRCKTGDGSETFPDRDAIYPFVGFRSHKMNQGGVTEDENQNSNVGEDGRQVTIQIWFSCVGTKMLCNRVTFQNKSGSYLNIASNLQPKSGSVVDKLARAVQEVHGEI